MKKGNAFLGVEIPKELKEQLQKRCEEDDISMSQFIRKAIRAYIEREKQ